MFERVARLYDYFPDWASGFGIFEFGDFPWGQNVGMRLNQLYFGTHSAYKRPSLLLRQMTYNNENPALGISQRETLANLLLAYYGDKWTIMFNSLHNLAEEENPTLDVSFKIDKKGTVSTTHEKTGTVGNSKTDSITYGGTDTTSDAGSDEVTNDGSDKTTETPSGADTFTITGEKSKKTEHRGTEGNKRLGDITRTDVGTVTTYNFGFDTPGADETGKRKERVGHDNEAHERYSGEGLYDSTEYNNDDTEKFSYTDYLETSTRGQKTDTLVEYGKTVKTDYGKTVTTNFGKTQAETHGETETYNLTDQTTETPNITTTYSGYKSKSQAETLVDLMKSSQWLTFVDTVFRDTDRVLTLSIY